MNDPQSCFSDTLVEPINLITCRTLNGQARPEILFDHVKDESQLQTALGRNDAPEWTGYQVISICQRNSYQPLQITASMMRMILQKYDINPDIARLSSCFFLRNKNLEEAVCVPFTEIRKPGRCEVFYSIRYPEYKPDYESWAMRHTGCYHLVDFAKRRHLFILLEPVPNSKLRQSVKDTVHDDVQRLYTDPLLMHRRLYSTYFSNWRTYLLSIESRLLVLEGKSFASYIDQPLLVGHEDLGRLYKIEAQLHQAASILANSSDTFIELQSLSASFKEDWKPEKLEQHNADTIRDLNNRQRECKSYAGSIKSMLAKTQSNIGFLANTVMLRDQVISKEQNVIMMQQNSNMVDQNHHMIRLNKSAVFITIVTLIYLPSSWLATFFGMNFFNLDPNTHRIVGSPMIWIYIVSSIGLTGVTFILYYFLLQRDGRLSSRLEPAVQAGRINTQWAMLKKRLTHEKGNMMEMHACNV